LEPELTLTAEGTFWHPLTFPGDVEMRISDELLPLADAVAAVEEELASDRRPARTEFR
jgi:hypothetical protein